MRKVVFTITCLLLSGLITGCGCSMHKEDIKPKSAKQMEEYVKGEYGKAKVSETVTKTDEYAEYILKDSEYGFTYTCKSYVDEASIDTPLRGYYENTNCDFDEAYRKYIYATLGIEDLVSGYYPGHFTFYFESEEAATQRLPELVTQIQQIDKKRYYFTKGRYDNSQILVYDKEKNYFGVVDIPTGKYLNKYEEQIENRKRDFAKAIYGGNSDGTAVSYEGITYLKYEQVQYKDVEGLNLEWIDYDNFRITGDSWTTAYYFDYKGKTYFIIEARVKIPANEALRANADFRLNYKENGYYNRPYTNYIFAD